MRVVDRTLLDQVTAQALESPRLRKNYNLHPSDTSTCHRLLNAIEPGSFIPPHRHLDTEKDETFVVLRGRLGVVTFDDRGEVTGTALLEACGERLAADIPHGTYHTAVSLESGTIFFEAKAGPYLPFTPEEKAPFAPEDGTPAAASFLERMAALFS